ncbi:MAG TPA: hypothetical protein VJ044_08495 [Candidatus Hodarchaeales archaeon]|nr:hypothetical protein [Candidatus Hodarchaeales archaeon]
MLIQQTGTGWQTMSHKVIVEKFASAYDVVGVFLEDAGRIIPLTQKNPKGLLVIRENLNKIKDGMQEMDYEGIRFGAIVNQVNEKTRIVLLARDDKIKTVAKHWERILPAVLKALPVSEIVEEESPITQIARITSQIGILLDEMIAFTKENSQQRQ